MAKIATSTQRNGKARNTGTLTSKKGLTSRELAEAEKLAYQFFVDRGYQHGYDQEDWLRAETIIRNGRS